MNRKRSIINSLVAFLFKSPSQAADRPSLRWVAGSFGMVWVFLVLFAIQKDHLVIASPSGDKLAVWAEDLSKLDSDSQNWYIGTQLTLDTLFPVFYGLAFLAAIGAFVPKRFQRPARITLWTLIACDYTENLLQIIYLMWPKYAAIGWVADVASCIKFALVALIAIAFLLRGLGRFVRIVQQRRFRSAIVQPTEQLVRARFPLLAIVFLAMWAPLAVNVIAISSITANMLLLSSYEQVGLLTCVNTLTILFAIAMLRAVWQHVEMNILSNQAYKSGRWAKWHYLLVFMLNLVTPMSAFHYSYMQESFSMDSSLNWIYLLAILFTSLGFFIAIAMMFLFGYAIGFAIGQTKGENNFFPAEDRDQAALLWDLRARPDLHFGLQMLFCFIVMCILFFVIFNFYEERLTWLSVSTLLIMFLWLIMAITTRLSIWFDEARIPTCIPLVVLVILTRFFTTNETLPVQPMAKPASTIQTSWSGFQNANRELWSGSWEFIQAQGEARKAASAESTSDKHVENESMKKAEAKVVTALERQSEARKQIEANVWQSVSKRFERRQANLQAIGLVGPQKKPTLVVVTCPGGGIHAAAWAALVLEKLDQRYVDFADSICLISGVSGGSVGTVFFAKHRFLGATPSQAIPPDTWKVTAKSSLEAVGAGLAFHDIPASFTPVWFGQDRGLRLENDWGRRLRNGGPNETLTEWGEFALEGKMPIVILNATDAASGRRVLFSTLPVPPRESLAGRLGRPLDYRELIDCPKFDVSIQTAARASATFPYVSPFACPEQASDIGKQVAICDGGFADNEGIVTAIDWLHALIRKASEENKLNSQAPFQRILLIRIQPNSDAEVALSESHRFSPASHLRWLTGPLEALASMRSTSQVERGWLESDLVTDYLATRWLTNNPPPGNGSPDGKPKDQDTIKHMLAEDMKKIEKYRADVNASDLETTLRMSQAVRQAQSKTGRPTTNQTEPTASRDDTPPALNIPAPPSSEIPELRVQVCKITFARGDADEPIPLNWKLSPKQISWYEQAWSSFLKASTTPDAKSQPSLSPLQILDSFFELRE